MHSEVFWITSRTWIADDSARQCRLSSSDAIILYAHDIENVRLRALSLVHHALQVVKAFTQEHYLDPFQRRMHLVEKRITRRVAIKRHGWDR
ncbi:hypothetical protein FGB62_5g519 [Gracilaria domingensis]|nr:hypothetical protein FGB62_5g519 [Gracilaria domingensis]